MSCLVAMSLFFSKWVPRYKKWYHQMVIRLTRLAFTVKYVAEAALIIAVTALFSLLTQAFSTAFWPQGGNIGFWMIPLILFATRWPWGKSALVCIAYGLLNFLLGGTTSPNGWDLLLEYVCGYLPFTSPCWFKFLIRPKNHASLSLLQQAEWKWYLFFGGSVITAALIYFGITFGAGVWFYSSYAPSGASVYLYSFVYNITYTGGSALVSLLILWFGKKQFKRIILLH